MKKYLSIIMITLMMFVPTSTVLADTISEGELNDSEEVVEEKKEVVLTKPTFTIKNNSYTSLRIEWKYNDENVSGYKIYRATSKSGKYKYIATVKTNEKELGTTLSYIDKSKTFNKTYYYKIRTYHIDENNNVKYSKYSSVVSKKVVTQAPTVSGTSTNFLKNKITWKKVSGASGYAIYKLVNGKYVYQKSTSSLSYTDTLKNSSSKLQFTNSYKVRAYRKVKGKKVYGPYSSVITVESKLTIPKLVFTSIDHTSYKLTNETVTGATSYELYSCIDLECAENTRELVATKSKLSEIINVDTMSQKQYFVIRAVRTVKGKSVYSAYSKVYTFSAIPKKLDVSNNKVFNKTVQGKNAIELKINNEDPTIRYEIVRATSKEGTYTKSNSLECKTTSQYLIDEYVSSNAAMGEIITEEQVSALQKYYSEEYPEYDSSYYCEDIGLKAGKTYYYQIRTIKTEDGVDYYSDYSNIVSVKIKPAQVTGIGTTPGKYNSTTIYWDDVATGADGYEVYRATSKNGKYTKIATTKNTSYVKSGTIGKKYYYKVRAYIIDDKGKKVYGSFSTITSRTIKPLNALDTYPVYLEDDYTSVAVKSVSTSVKSTTSTSVIYNFKFNYSKTWSSYKRNVTFMVYFYDKNFNLIATANFPITVSKGTKKNYYTKFQVKVPKEAVYYEFR